jgi:Zn-dependent M28 family amino/carboxypeptidase
MNQLKTLGIVAVSLIVHSCAAQKINAPEISQSEVSRVIKTLSADEMMGRSAMKPEQIRKAADFIAAEFEKAGLKYFNGGNSYLQTFITGKAKLPMFNVVGVLPGKSKPNEYVVFSAHYDHLGVIKAVNQDSIANGADDDASGTTAVIELAKYFSRKNDNERTLIFVAFTAEEIGGYGSQYFSKQLNPDEVVAMFNIEMIGKESKFGKNNAFITGYERSDFGKILQKNLVGTDFKFYPDPYPKQNLFYRSDNATLAKLGVPAHTISSDQIDTDKLYHSVDDEFESMDIGNITEIIKAIAISSTSIVEGKDTPSRVSGVK